ncbi:serine/threonine protein kinase [Gloeothece citriformis PCC 7424]|uniref:non-specific serine/threonine protein kinase n=2 Tax=Gloeothece TaxID=28070 RepID=B7KIJ2_GLOC7|nr:serine/threonine protein kinase [Gloeothece citriformis PCC 7424]
MPEPGDIIGNRYKILKFLGKGGFGVTYLAEDTRLEDNYLCVVKHLTNSQAIENFRERTRREATILRELGNNHSQIPAFLDYLEVDNHIYIVQQYIGGTSLKDVFAVNPQWNEQQVKNLLRELLLILQNVHQANIIHRDIKPSNLIRSQKDNKIVLIDFGVAREYNSTTQQNLTNLGTQGYSPPEQWIGSPRFCSDIYSVGIIAIQALTGKDPIKEQWERDDNGVLNWRDQTPVSDRFADIIDKMTAFHFNERYQSVKEVLESLNPHLSPKPQPPLNLNLNWRKLGIGLGLGVMLLGGLALSLPPKNVKTPCPIIESNGVSCGGFIISKNNLSFQKQKAVTAYQKGDYQQALDLFKQARKEQPNEAEILIYINNLELLVNQIPLQTIAVTLPLSDHNHGADAGQEILKGIAQAQQYINQRQDLNPYGLQVIIADDNNNLEKAQKIANKFGKEPKILAVMSNSSREIIQDIIPLYTQHQLNLLSLDSSSDSLRNSSPFFFPITGDVKDPNFQKQAEQLWRGSLTWRTARGYNGILILAHALAQNTSSNFLDSIMITLNPKFKRIQLQKTLKKSPLEVY